MAGGVAAAKTIREGARFKREMEKCVKKEGSSEDLGACISQVVHKQCEQRAQPEKCYEERLTAFWRGYNTALTYSDKKTNSSPTSDK